MLTKPLVHMFPWEKWQWLHGSLTRGILFLPLLSHCWDIFCQCSLYIKGKPEPASQPASQVASNQFAISQNPRQQSNEAEMPMLIDNYSDQKQKELRLQSMQKALLVRDVSSGQKNWQLGFVQVGITEYWGCVRSSKQHTFPPASQPYCQWRGKFFMKGQFMKWYSAEIQQ